MPNSADYISPFALGQYAATKAGDPYLWMPYGPITKNGETILVDRNYAAKFKLPHFKPPIKLGSHDEPTPAGGHIVAYELRDSGIWVTPELVASGEKALADGAYRYHSPEVIWEGGYILDSTTGQKIYGPLIMGDALLHTPALGEKTSLYVIERKESMTEQIISVPVSWLERMFGKKEAPAPEPPAPKTELAIDGEEIKKLQAEASKATTLQAELDNLKAEASRKEQLTALAAEMGDVKQYNATIAGKPAEVAAHLSAMPAAEQDWVKQQFKALSAQISETELLKKHGDPTQQSNDNPVAQFNAAVLERSVKDKVDYPTAVRLVATEQKDLYEAYLAAR